MKLPVLARYERTASGDCIIDVAVSQVEDMYNDYDRNAPYIRRDLDHDLVDYLIECAKELNSEPFVIRFTLSQPPDNSKQSRVRRSINAYFLYLAELEQQQVIHMVHNSGILFSIGIGILFLSVSINQILGEGSSLASQVFAEGITIAAWLSLWESLAFFLLKWFPCRRNILLFRRLAEVELIFRPEVQTTQNPVETTEPNTFSDGSPAAVGN